MTAALENNRLELVLQLAEKGWHVFPIAKGKKTPALKGSWKKHSTTDSGQITAWLNKLPGCNFAVDCEKSKLAVIDIDVRDGKPGMESLEMFCQQYGELTETFTVTTPSGGKHYYYKGNIPSTASTVFGKGIDTRGKGGYIILPGSRLANDGVYRIENHAEVKDVPDSVKRAYADSARLKEEAVADRMRERSENLDDSKKESKCCKHKLLPAVRRVLEFARNDSKFQMLMSGAWKGSYSSQSEADMALLTKLAFYCGKNVEQMMLIFSLSGLARDKWRDREDYRDSTISKALTMCSDVHAVYEEQAAEQGIVSVESDFYKRQPLTGAELALKKPQDIEWIFSDNGGLPRNIVGFLAGQGGCGKSTLALQIALSVVSGIDCTSGKFAYEAKGPVLAVFAEEDEGEIVRRQHKVSAQYGLKANDLKELYILQRGSDPQLCSRNISGGISFTRNLSELKRLVDELQPVLIILDSFSVLAGEAEGTNPDAARVVTQLAELCEAGDKATVLILTHVTKASLSQKGQSGSLASKMQALEQALEPTSLRGASALVNNARWIMTMTHVPKTLCSDLELYENNVVACAVRKTNYGAPLMGSFFSNKEGVLVPLHVMGVESSRPSYDEVILKMLQGREICKTPFVAECKKALPNVSKRQIMDVIEALIEGGRIGMKKRNGTGGGKVLFVQEESQ